MISRSLHIKLNNCFQRHLTYLCLRASTTGWIPACAPSCVLEVPACTTSSSITLPRVLTMNCPKSCYQCLLIPLMLIEWNPKLPTPPQINRYHLPIVYPNYSQTMSVRALRPLEYLLPKNPSLVGTSAPLLTNPSLTSFLNNYPNWPTAPSLPLKSASEDNDAQSEVPTLPSALPGAGTAPSLKRGRGRPPKMRKRLVRVKARTRKERTPTTAPSETAMPTEASEAPRYQLRSRRQPRYKCGTCGLRDCVCLLAVNENRRVPPGARGVPPERGENLVHRLTVRAEKTYSSLERSGDYPVDIILEKLSSPGVAKAPYPRFKEWTSDGKGLEFTLATVMPPVPSNIAFGPFNFEREPVQMVRCITADLLGDKYGIHVDPGGVYSPAPHWWLLVTAPRVEAIVETLHLLSCLEGLRTLTTADLILCFHIIDWYRGKVKFAWWLELKRAVTIERCHARCGKTWLQSRGVRPAYACLPTMGRGEKLSTRELCIQPQQSTSHMM